MKFSKIILFIVFVCLCYTKGLKFVNPVVYEVQERFKLSWDQLKGKCDSKGADLFSAVSKLRDQYDFVSPGVKTSILDEAKKCSGTVTEEKWNQLIETKCIVNPELVKISQQAIDKIVLCLDNNGGLDEEKKQQAKKELLGRFCSMIKTWARFEYNNHKGKSQK